MSNKAEFEFLRAALSGRLEKEVLDDALSYLDFNESRLALETLADQLIEYEVQLSGSEVAAIRALADVLNAGGNRFAKLEKLVR